MSDGRPDFSLTLDSVYERVPIDYNDVHITGGKAIARNYARVNLRGRGGGGASKRGFRLKSWSKRPAWAIARQQSLLPVRP